MSQVAKHLQIKSLPAGRYVVAVSGGVDSMVLLDLLRQQKQIQLVVTHFDHGIRADSAQDRLLVQRCATSHNITFEYEEGQLGPTVGEDKARRARYNFLRRICKKYNARAIVTAHHQDDLLETAIINMVRGTGRRGLSALRSHPDLVRPLLRAPKAQLLAYASTHKLVWREDPTNRDVSLLRNYVRHRVLVAIDEQDRKKLLNIIVRHYKLNQHINSQISEWLKAHAIIDSHSTALPRYPLIMMSPIVAYEILQTVLQRQTGKTVEGPLAKKALLFVKTSWPHKIFVINNEWQLRAQRNQVIVEARRRMLS